VPVLPALALSLLIPAQTAGVVVDLSDDSPVLTRLIIRDVTSEVLDEQAREVLGEALTVELRKLRGLDVIAMRDLRTLLEIEVEKQVVGCEDDSSCLAELADTMGADGWLTSDVSLIGTERVIALARFDARRARVTHRAQLRVSDAANVALLETIGPAVEQLFPELKLREGETRGVAPALEVKMSPPPVPEWAFWTTAGATGVALASAGVLAGLSWRAYEESEELLRLSATPGAIIPASEVRARYDESVDLATAAQIVAVSSAALALTTALLIPLTHFDEGEP
jgi:hypothetical protein